MRDIIIKPALNGFVVRMGCQRIVFCDRDIMIRALNDYLDDPNKTEDQYMLNSIHSKQFGFTRPQLRDGSITECEAPREVGAYSSSHED